MSGGGNRSSLSLKSRRQEVEKQLGSEAAKQPGFILGCHAELVSASCNRHGAKTLKRVQGDKAAFTLAEVLITLGIIGVVAALTLPSLIQNHNNRVVEAKLKKIYSTMNQAIALAEIDYGDRVDWYNYPDLNFDKNGNPVKGSSGQEKWVNKYIAPYLKTNKVSVGTDTLGRPRIYFQDGSILSITSNGYNADWVFWTNHKGWGCGHNGTAAGRCVFYFNYCPDCAWFGDSLKYIRRNFEPYKHGWDGSYDKLKENCATNRTYCTALIQYNGWKIPKDYPHKVRY